MNACSAAGVCNYAWARLLSRRFKHGDNLRFPRRSPQVARAVVAELIQTRTRVRVLAARASEKTARRRVVTDVSLLPGWHPPSASVAAERRLRARLDVRSLLIFLAQFAALSWPSLTLGGHMNPLGLPRTCHGSLSEVPPSGPNPREVDLPQLSPWTLACVRDTLKW